MSKQQESPVVVERVPLECDAIMIDTLKAGLAALIRNAQKADAEINQQVNSALEAAGVPRPGAEIMSMRRPGQS